ncbi:MAG: hypothetical protein ACD_73C00457G0002 [uncultured bacterium]|nr:MAG: hypothetical protein ACD_73C00457G0002 [uncultured bacterium]
MAAISYHLAKDCDSRISYFFLKFRFGFRPIPIWKLYEKSMDVAFHPGMVGKKLEGHVILNGGRGVLEFDCEPVVRLPQQAPDDKFDLVKLKIIPGSESIVNRRQFLRKNFDSPVEILIHHQEHNKETLQKIWLTDFGAGGLGFQAPLNDLKLGEIYYVTIPKGYMGDAQHYWPLLMVRDFVPKKSHLEGLHGFGGYFVTNKEILKGPPMTDAMQSFIIRLVNRSTILSKKLLD